MDRGSSPRCQEAVRRPTRVYSEGVLFPEYLSNREGFTPTIRIDSQATGRGRERRTATGSRKEAAEALRQIVATVGKKGQPGEHVRCIVSVAMLNEGWDANNVTNILGVRAFASQLLCEQVVGRGLRRMDYTRRPHDWALHRRVRGHLWRALQPDPLQGASARRPRSQRTGPRTTSAPWKSAPP